MTRTSTSQLIAFAHAARERSITKAAATLGVSQSSVTQQITKLERKMGQQLFIRSADGLELTRTGRDLFPVAEKLQTLERLAEEKINNYSSMTTGHLDIVANTPFPALAVMTKFLEEFPKVNVNFTLVSWTLAMRLLQDRDTDIAFVVEPNPTQKEMFFSMPLSPTRYMAHMPKTHRLAQRRAISLRELAEEVIIVPEDGSLTQMTLDKLAASQGIVLRRVVKMATFPLVREAALFGVGIGLFLDRSMFPIKDLVEVPISEMDTPYMNYLLAPKDKCDLRVVAKFIEISSDTNPRLVDPLHQGL